MSSLPGSAPTVVLRGAAGLAVVVSVAAVTGGCTRTLSYGALEESGSLCVNGIDDDGDGLLDCAEPDCRGTEVCVEREGRCDNDVDDDGDGLVDVDDPGCWPGARVTVEGCASVAGSELAVPDEGWLGGPSVELREGAAGRPDANVLALTAVDDVVATPVAATGAVVGTDVHVAVSAPLGTMVEVLVLPDEDVPVGTARPVPGSRALTVVLHDFMTVALHPDLPESMEDFGPVPFATREWADVWVAFDEGEIEVRAVRYVDGPGGPVPRTFTGRLAAPVSWRPDEPLRVIVHAASPGTEEDPALVADLRISRPAHHPCGRPVALTSPDRVRTPLSAVAATAGSPACGLGQRVDSIGSSSAGTFPVPPTDAPWWEVPIAEGPPGAFAVQAGALARDGAGGLVAAVTGLPSALAVTPSIVLLTAPGCEGPWETVGKLDPTPAFEAPSEEVSDVRVAYDVQGGVHRLAATALLSPPGEMPQWQPIVVLRRESDGRWAVEERIALPPELVDLDPRTDPVRLSYLEGHLVISTSSGEEASLFVRAGGSTWSRLPRVLTPSFTAGAFDERRVGAPIAVLTSQPGGGYEGWLLYSGAGGPDCIGCVMMGEAQVTVAPSP